MTHKSGWLLVAVLALTGCTAAVVTPPDLAPMGCDGGVDVCGCTADKDCPSDRPRCTTDTHACVTCLPVMDNCGKGSHCIFDRSGYSCSMTCRYNADCKAIDPNLTCCNGGCLDMTTDVNNCGACGKMCAALPHSFPACAGSECVVGKCADGFADCDKSPINGCETDLTADPKNCGACGSGCLAFANGSQSCVARTCTPTCTAGYGDCNKNGGDGCEAYLLTDNNNCGACGAACKPLANAQIACQNNKCQIASCNAGFDDCDGQTGNGCETNLNNDPNNCNGCKNKCNLPNAVSGCSGALCTVASCNAGFGDCNMAAGDGCEVPTNSDPFNCGGCGVKCKIPHANASCTNGACGFLSCAAGFSDCNKNQADGCEQATDSDPLNCGGCGIVCPNNAKLCVNSVCTNSTHNLAVLVTDWSAQPGCGDASTWYSQNFGTMNYAACEALANKYGAQYMGQTGYFYGIAGNNAYAGFTRWVGEADVNNAWVGTANWSQVTSTAKTNQNYCVLAYANGQNPGNAVFANKAVSQNGQTYLYNDYGNIPENTCYTNARLAGARPLNPYMLQGVAGNRTHMVENHGCHGSVQYTGIGAYSNDGGSNHNYECVVGYIQ